MTTPPLPPSRFSVENAGNSCYVDSVIVGLFCPSSNSDYVLQNMLSTPQSQSIQNALKDIVSNIRSGTKIPKTVIAEFRRQCRTAGWEAGEIQGKRDAQQCAGEFVRFVLDQLNSKLIKYFRKTAVMDAIASPSSDIGSIEPTLDLSLALITDDSSASSSPPLGPSASSSSSSVPSRPKRGPKSDANDSIVHISDLIATFFLNNVVTVMRRTAVTSMERVQRTGVANYLLIGECPPCIPVHLKRFDNSLNKIKRPVKIPLTLDFSRYADTDQDGAFWRDSIYYIGGIVCHSGRSLSLGHYYTVFTDSSTLESAHLESLTAGSSPASPSTPSEAAASAIKWFRFDDLKKPCSVEPLRGSALADETIQKDAYILFYFKGKYSKRRMSSLSSSPLAPAGSHLPIPMTFPSPGPSPASVRQSRGSIGSSSSALDDALFIRPASVPMVRLSSLPPTLFPSTPLSSSSPSSFPLSVLVPLPPPLPLPIVSVAPISFSASASASSVLFDPSSEQIPAAASASPSLSPSSLSSPSGSSRSSSPSSEEREDAADASSSPSSASSPSPSSARDGNGPAVMTRQRRKQMDDDSPPPERKKEDVKRPKSSDGPSLPSRATRSSTRLQSSPPVSSSISALPQQRL